MWLGLIILIHCFMCRWYLPALGRFRIQEWWEREILLTSASSLLPKAGRHQIDRNRDFEWHSFLIMMNETVLEAIIFPLSAKGMSFLQTSNFWTWRLSIVWLCEPIAKFQNDNPIASPFDTVKISTSNYRQHSFFPRAARLVVESGNMVPSLYGTL